MEYKLEHKEAFTAIGFSTRIKSTEGYAECPRFWDREYNEKYKRLWRTGKPENDTEHAICDNGIGMLALCADEGECFEYMIAGVYRGGRVPEGMKLMEVPESDWAVFSTKGPLPGSLQALNTDIWQKWYPAEGRSFEPNGTVCIEYYTEGDMRSTDYECGMWIPIRKK